MAGPTQPRRVTRSQSPGYQHISLKSTRNLGKGKAVDQRLETVTEETPISSRQTSLSKHSSPVVQGTPEQAEANHNISGTTFLEAEDFETDSEDEASDDPIIMLDELPDLQQAASGLMNLLVSNQQDPIAIVNAAKRIRVAGPSNKDYRRLKSHCKKLVERMKKYGNAAFVDVPRIRDIIPTISARVDEKPWSPSPILHSANCARLAYEVLLSTAESEPARQVVKSLNSQFPAPFLDQFVKGRDSNLVGFSAVEKAAWELALEIRTQYFLMEYERCQSEKGFDPSLLLRTVFYDESKYEGGDLDSRWLRGFSVTPFHDENGCLPDRFHDAALDHIGELELELTDDDGALNVKGLRAAFSWQRFTVRTARFLHSRDKEIRRDLKSQADFDDVHDLLERKIKGESVLNETHVQEDSSVFPDDSLFQATTPNNRDPEKNQPLREMSPPAQQRSFATETTLTGSPQKSIGQPSPVSLGKRPADSRPHRRKSGKNQFLNMDSISRFKQRLVSVASDSPVQQRPVPQDTTGNKGTVAENHIDDYVPFDDTNEDFDLSGEPDESTTPPGSARTRQVSYNPSLQFDSPGPSRLRAPPMTNDEQESQPAQKAGEASLQTPQRTIFDRQNDARRVSPIDETETQSAERRPARPNGENSRKRARGDTEEESDDDFEQDSRASNTATKRAIKPPPKRHAPARQERDETLESASEAGEQLQQQLISSQAAARKMPWSSSTATTQELAPAPALAPAPTVQSAWAARNISAQRPPGKGGKWSQEEDDRIIRGVAVHGTSWSTIIKEDKLCPDRDGGPVLLQRQRSQVDIKDRARVLKRKMMKAGTPLPRGFEKVGNLKY
ncbi:hypothetical protein N7520_003657 [Penicillium odoratum]|uniref:uncharacterized protein n=1 Tax=Penicillium odoratum TaxID=1167516 RepID=UPI0025498A86|nr:uncharacterized protein N7520_003657 [Penicillium odoratum]KAJ5769098.1 hypothetical protein N7520_003657 [Penicillium odoratum]